MSTRTAVGDGFALSVEYPDTGWYIASKVVPALHSPHELCVISNRPLRKVPVTSEQNIPDISALDAAGYLIWIYYEVLGDPAIGDPQRPPIPDYSHYSYPLAYSESQLFPVQKKYDWSSRILWRRVGHNLAPTVQRPERAAVTVMIWEGTRASVNDVDAAEAMVASISISEE